MVKVSHFHVPVAAIFLVLLDILISYLSISAGLHLSYAPNDFLLNISYEQFTVEKALFISLTIMSFVSIGVYYRPFLTNMRLGLLTLAISHIMALGLLALVFYALPDKRIWISALIPALMLSFLGVFLAHMCFDRLIGIKLFQTHVVVVGSGEQAGKVQHAIDGSPYLTCVASVPSYSEDAPDVERSPQYLRLVELARLVGADEIVVTTPDQRDTLLNAELLECRTQGIQVSELASFLERVNGYIEVQGLSPSWMIYSGGFSSIAPIQRNIKRFVDVVLSLVFVVLTMPILLIAGFAIYLETLGPVFYRQTRVGLGGRHFTLWKLRSMHLHAEADGVARWAEPNDERTTKIGQIIRRLRIDELPQLYNVLVGDMSFVGPRPERPEFVERLLIDVPFYNYRHNVKPGITGWAQINYPYGNNLEGTIEKLKYDLFYVKNGSLALDFLVFLQTIRVIIWPNAGTAEKTQLDVPATASQALERNP